MKLLSSFSIILYAVFTLDLPKTSFSEPDPWNDIPTDTPEVVTALNHVKEEISSKHALLPTDTFRIEDASNLTEYAFKDFYAADKNLLDVFRVTFDVFSAQGERVFKSDKGFHSDSPMPACKVFIAKTQQVGNKATPVVYSIYDGPQEEYCHTEKLLHR